MRGARRLGWVVVGAALAHGAACAAPRPKPAPARASNAATNAPKNPATHESTNEAVRAKSIAPSRPEVRKAMEPCTRTLTTADAPRLGAILAEQAAGAVLCLEAGTYRANLRISRSITLRAADGAGDGQVVLDGGGTGSTVTVSDPDAEVVIAGLVLRRGDGGGMGGGGNVSVLAARSVTLRDARLEDGTADKNGGGGIFARDGVVTLEGCRLVGNTGARGQAVLVAAGAEVVLRDCTITGGAPGKALVYVDGATRLEVERCTIASTEAPALHIDGTKFSAPTVTVARSILGRPAFELRNPGPPPSLSVSASALSEALPPVAKNGGDNAVGPLDLDAELRPKAGSISVGRGPAAR